MPRNLKEGDLECRLGKPNRAGDNERKISKVILDHKPQHWEIKQEYTSQVDPRKR